MLKVLPRNVQRLPSGSLRLVVHHQGRRVFVTLPAKSTRADIEAERARLTTELASQPRRARTALGSLIEELHAEWTGGPNTLADRRRVVRDHFPPELLDTDVADITTLMVHDFYRSLRARGLSPHRVGRCADVLGSSLQHAAKLGVIPTNPARNAPRPVIPRREITPPSPELLERILDSIPFGWLAVAVELAFVTGARRGEIAALGWDLVDLEAGVIMIHRNAIDVAEIGVVLKDTKVGHRGRRPVSIDDATVAMLRRWRSAQIAAGLRVGSGPSPWLFPAPGGSGPRRADGLTQAWSRHLVACELPHVRLHDLRHYAVTAAIAAGVPISLVSRRAGHSTTAVTQDRYGHFVPAVDREITAAITATMPGRRGVKR